MHPLVIYAFIDSQNLYLGVKAQGWELDFKRFRVYLKEKYWVKKAFLFIGYIPKNKNLYKSLKECGYELIYKPVIKDRKNKIKGNVDAELVLHTMIEFPNYDQAIIVSGDGDFYCLASYLAENNKLLKIIVPSERYSSLLRKLSPYILQVSQFQGKVIR